MAQINPSSVYHYVWKWPSVIMLHFSCTRFGRVAVVGFFCVYLPIINSPICSWYLAEIKMSAFDRVFPTSLKAGDGGQGGKNLSSVSNPLSPLSCVLGLTVVELSLNNFRDFLSSGNKKLKRLITYM